MENRDHSSLAESAIWAVGSVAAGGLSYLETRAPYQKLPTAEFAAGALLLICSLKNIVTPDGDHPRPLINKLVDHIGFIASGALIGAAYGEISGAVTGAAFAASIGLVTEFVKGRHRLNPKPEPELPEPFIY